MNGVTASLILGIAWACWHLPLIFTIGAPMANNSILLLFVLLPAESVVYTWLYQHTRGSILAAALFHALIGLWAIASPAAEATGRPQLIRVILWCALAGVLLLKYGANLTGRQSVSTDGSSQVVNPRSVRSRYRHTDTHFERVHPPLADDSCN
jgi:membrane protease YdiL (CAAX protease family)